MVRADSRTKSTNYMAEMLLQSGRVSVRLYVDGSIVVLQPPETQLTTAEHRWVEDIALPALHELWLHHGFTRRLS